MVAIRPGKYVEGVVLDGTARRKDFDDLTIEGTKKDPQAGDPRRQEREGRTRRGAERDRGDRRRRRRDAEHVGAQLPVERLLRPRRDRAGGQHCDGYTMDNLLASSNRSYGLFAKGCLGGKMINSAGYHQGDSAFYVGETPCDKRNWNVHSDRTLPEEADVDAAEERPQLRKRARLLGHELEVRADRRIGLLQQRRRDRPQHARQRGLRAERLERDRTQRRVLEQLQLLPRRCRRSTPSPRGSANSVAQTVNYPTGVGIVLYGGDGNVVRRNQVFGNYKWGIASFSGPGETFVANEGNEAKNVNNEIVENMMGREGADPNGEYDFWNDDTGGGNCWGAQQRRLDLRAGQRQGAAEPDLPVLPAGAGRLRRRCRASTSAPGCRSTMAEIRQPDDDPRLRRHQPAAEPAVHLGAAGRRPPAVPELQAGRSRRRRRVK